MRKYFLITIVIFVFIVLLVSCTNANVAQSQSKLSTLESENAELKTKASESATETTVAEAATETTQVEVKKEFSPSVAGNLYIAGYTSAVWVEGDYAYLNSTDSFKIVDVGDKENPEILASMGLVGSYGSFCVKDNYAYIVYQDWDKNGTKFKGSGFEVIDVSDKENPKIVGKYNSKDQIFNIFVAGKYVYAAFQVIEYEDIYYTYTVLDIGFQIVDITDKEKPNLINEYSIKPQNGMDGYVSFDNNFAYISGDEYLKIIDITNKDSFTEKGNLYLPIGSIGSGFLYFKDNYLYALSTNTLEIIDVSDKEKPTLAGGFVSKGYISGIFVLEDYTYTTYSIYKLNEQNREFVGSGLQIMDLKSLKLVGEVKVNGEALGIFVSGDYAYIAAGPTGLQIIKLFNEQ